MVAEYGGTQPTDEGGVKYIQQDIQGSTRAITSVSGAVKARMDYAAFGEEISASVGQRTVQGYSSSDSLRQKYALTERDDASGLDHTWFRKHENRAGRWTSPDPYNGSMNISDPQSFNRYSYVENQPTNFVDPSGLLMMGSYCSTGFEWRPHIEGGGDWVVVNRCFLVPGSDSASGASGAAGAGLQGGRRPKAKFDIDKFKKCLKDLFQVELGLSDGVSGDPFTTKKFDGFRGKEPIQVPFDYSKNSAELQKIRGKPVAGYSSMAEREVHIANDLSPIYDTATRVHEVGNKIFEKFSMYGLKLPEASASLHRAMLRYGGEAFDDKDAGIALEECVFDGVVLRDGTVLK